MKKIPLFLSVCASVLVSVTGCTTANEAVKAAAAKNVNASGVVSMQDIQTGYDPVTGSVTPKVLLVTGSLNYRSNVVSVPEGSKVPDAAEYSREESAALWNAEAKSVNVRWNFTASTPEQADARMKALLDYDAQQAAQAPESTE